VKPKDETKARIAKIAFRVFLRDWDTARQINEGELLLRVGLRNFKIKVIESRSNWSVW